MGDYWDYRDYEFAGQRLEKYGIKKAARNRAGKKTKNGTSIGTREKHRNGTKKETSDWTI